MAANLVTGTFSCSATTPATADGVKRSNREFLKICLDGSDMQQLEKQHEMYVSRDNEMDPFYQEFLYTVQWGDIMTEFYSDGKPMSFYRDRDDPCTTPTLSLPISPFEGMKSRADAIVQMSGGERYKYTGCAYQESGISNGQVYLGSKVLILSYMRQIAGRYSMAHSITLGFQATNGRLITYRWWRTPQESFEPQKIDKENAMEIARREILDEDEDVAKAKGQIKNLYCIGVIPYLKQREQQKESKIIADRFKLEPVWLCIYGFWRNDKRFVCLVYVNGYTGEPDKYNLTALKDGESISDCIRREYYLIPIDEIDLGECPQDSSTSGSLDPWTRAVAHQCKRSEGICIPSQRIRYPPHSG